MAIPRWITVFGVALAVSLPAQQQAAGPAATPTTARLFRFPDLARFDEGMPPGQPKALTRLIEVLRNTPMGDAPARSLVLSVLNDAGRVMARGTAAQIDAVTKSLKELTRSDLGTARLHFSIVNMPLAVATEHALEPGRTVMSDEATWTALLRDAVKAKGTVHNLPEVTTAVLAPFRREPTPVNGAPDATAPRLRGEVVPLGDDEIAVALEVDRKWTTGEGVTRTIAKPVFRLTAGKAAMMTVVDRDRAVVVIARCLEVGAASK